MTPRGPPKRKIRDISAELGYPANGWRSELTIAMCTFLRAREKEPYIVNISAHPEDLEPFAIAFFNEYHDPDEKTITNAEHFWGVNSGSQGPLLWPQHSDKIMKFVCHIFYEQRSGRISAERGLRKKAHKEQIRNSRQSVPQKDQVLNDYDSNFLSDPELIPRGTLSRPYQPDIESEPMFQPQMTEFLSHDGFPGDFSVFGEETLRCPLRSSALITNSSLSQNMISPGRQSTSVTYDVSDADQPVYQPVEPSSTTQNKKHRKFNRSTHSHVAQLNLTADPLGSDRATNHEISPTSPQRYRSSSSGTALPHHVAPLVDVLPSAQKQQAFTGEYLPHNSMLCASPYQSRTPFGQVSPAALVSNSTNFPQTSLQSISSGQGSLELGTVIEDSIRYEQGTQRGASIEQTWLPQAQSSTSNVPLPDSNAEQTEIETQPAHATVDIQGSQHGLDVLRPQTWAGENAESPIVLDNIPYSSLRPEREPELISSVKTEHDTPPVLAEAKIQDVEETSNTHVALLFQFLVYDKSDGRFKKNHTEYPISELPDDFDFEASTISEFFKFYESEEVSRAPKPLPSLKFSFPVELRERYICPVIKSNAHERVFKGIKNQILQAVNDWAKHYPDSDSMIIEVVIPGWQPAPPMNARKADPNNWNFKSHKKSITR